VQELLEQLGTERCQIIVCAARTKGEVDKVFQALERRYVLTDVQKKPSAGNTHEPSNFAAAHSLAACVFAAIDA
jgi:hypothetical protein